MSSPNELIEESPEQVAGAVGDSGPEARSFDEAIALYEGEWVLMKVIEFDAFYRPERGLVIAHSPDRGAVSEALRKEPPRLPDASYQPYYTFNASPRMHSSEAYDDAAARIAAQRAAAQEYRHAQRRP